MDEEHARTFLVSQLRKSAELAAYGYEVYVPKVVNAYLSLEEGLKNELERGRRPAEVSPAFLGAAWELTRRGVLRPGVARFGAQSTAEGGAGSGFSLTAFGRSWLAESDRDDFVPTEPGRFASLISRHADRFGSSYQERAQEAIRAYGAHCPLACCVMCGAAAEAVLLATASARSGDLAAVLAEYNSSGGRGRVTTTLLGQVPERVRRTFLGHLELLKYWRDDASHGAVTGIGDDEAFTSLAVLLRFGDFVAESWDTLTAAP